jgi:hypothetical protein
MATLTLTLNIDAIHYQVRRTVGELCSSAENLRLVAASLENTAGELLADAHSEDARLRNAAQRGSGCYQS